MLQKLEKIPKAKKLKTSFSFFFLILVRPSLEPGWLEGNLDGKFGLVPENYVEFIS